MDPTDMTEYTNSTTESMLSQTPNAKQIASISHLLLVFLLGTIGNVMTIIAVRIERKLRESLANMFVTNLAVADLVVCSTVVPMLIAHDAMGEALFGPAMCYVAVVVSGIACHTAAATMTCIAVTRYIAATRATNYHSIITRSRIYLAIILVWSFAAINTVPILIAWVENGYDSAKYVCVCFDGTFPLYYTLGPVFIGHFLPHAITIYCYFCIVRAMRKSRRRVISTSTANNTTNDTLASISDKDNRKRSAVMLDSESDESQVARTVSSWSQHEVQLLKTSIWIIGFFSFCWIPYGVLVLLQDLTPFAVKKTFAALCLLSFSLNPVIYGLLSKSFRRAYKRIIRKVFCGFCCLSDSLNSGIYSTSSATTPRKYQVNDDAQIKYGHTVMSTT